MGPPHASPLVAFAHCPSHILDLMTPLVVDSITLHRVSSTALSHHYRRRRYCYRRGVSMWNIFGVLLPYH